LQLAALATPPSFLVYPEGRIAAAYNKPPSPFSFLLHS
jgi:hypothetical protein